jgi:hypothetical protein
VTAAIAASRAAPSDRKNAIIPCTCSAPIASQSTSPPGKICPVRGY